MSTTTQNIQFFPNKLKTAKAALLFLDGQFAFQEETDQGEIFKFLSPESVRTAFLNEPVDSGWLPVATIRHGTTSDGVWAINFYPAQTYRIRIRTKQTQSIEVHLPSALFIGRGKSYYILAAKENAFHPQMELFRYPLPNVSNAGAICFGSNTHSEATPLETARLFSLFMGTIFNHHHVDKKSQRKEYEADIVPLLLALAESKETYPLDDLVSHQTTPQTIIQQISKTNSEY